jgi:IPT/TIG domain
MQRIHRIFLMTVLFLVAVPVVRLLAWRIPVEPVAVMEQIAPEAAMPGETVTVTGYGLDASNVRQVYLVFGKIEYRVGILEQTSTVLRFTVPADAPTGTMRVAATLTGRAELMEQPVVLRVLEGVMTQRRRTPAR